MKTIIKRSILDYLKNPVLWIGLIIIVASMYQCLSSYLQIHYIKQNEQITQNDVALEDADGESGKLSRISTRQTSVSDPPSSL